MNSLLTQHYDRANLRHVHGLTRFSTAASQTGTDRWHVARRPLNEWEDEDDGANVGLVVRAGIAVMFVRRARLVISGQEDRDCAIHHLWRTSDVDDDEMNRRGQELLPESDRVAVVLGTPAPAGGNTYHVTIGDDWAFVRYRGPIFPHPDEGFALQLMPGGVAFAMGAKRDDCITPSVDLGAAEDIRVAFPHAGQDALDPHSMTLFRRTGIGAWAFRLQLVKSGLVDSSRLEHDMPGHANNLGQRCLAHRLRMLRTFHPECGPLATFTPHRTFSQSLTISIDLPPPFNTLPGFDPWYSFFGDASNMQTTTRFLQFLVTDNGTRLTATFSQQPVYFMPLVQHPRRVLLFVNSTTFFLLEDDPGMRLKHPPGLPARYGVGLVGLKTPEDATRRIVRAVSEATDVPSMLHAIAAIFNAHLTTTPLSMLMYPESPAVSGEDPMDLVVDQSL